MKSGTADKKIARQRIQKLFQLARDVISEDEASAQRYVTLARKISMASRVRIPRDLSRQVCRSCKRFILPGVNCRVRIRQRREPHMVITCSYCGNCTRIPLRTRKGKNIDDAQNEA